MGTLSHLRRGVAQATDDIKNQLALLVLVCAQFRLPTGLELDPRTDASRSYVRQQADLVGIAVSILSVIVVLAFSALIGGEVLGAINVTGPFSDTVDDIETFGGLALMLLALVLIVLPVVAIIGLLKNVQDGNGGGRMGRFR